MTKHTLGPWTFRGCDGGWAIDFNEDQEQVVDYVYEEADARLIAAAPELLEALENLLAVREGKGGTKYHADDIARAAIAKAKGE